MNTLTAEQRGDLAEQMLPVAAHLAVLVHGDGGPEDVAEVLAGLDDTSKNALIVTLAGLVDPEQPVGKALGWLDFNEHGALTVPSWSEERSVRDLAPEPDVDADDEYVDQVAVTKFVRGFPVAQLTDTEFLEAVRQCATAGMSSADIDRLRGWPRKTAENWVNRLRKRYQRAGRVFPDLGVPKPRVFSEQEVVVIRQRAAEGATDVEIAMAYGTNATIISGICRGRTYRQYGGPVRAPKQVQHLEGTRKSMCGHASNSLAARKKHEMGEAA